MSGIGILLASALVGAAAALVGPMVLAQGPAEAMKPTAEIAALPGVYFNEALAAALPAAVGRPARSRVATNLTPPISFHGETGGLVGHRCRPRRGARRDPGVEVRRTDAGAGAAIAPSILSGRFDVSISGINDDPELEKQVDVIGYMYDATTIMTLQGDPLGVASLEDLCGKRVAVSVGAFQNRLVQAASETCGVPMEILSLPKMPEVLQAVRTGRADATLNGDATSVYTTGNQVGNGKGLEALPEVRLAVGYLGMLTAKDNPELRDVLVAALEQMVAAGGHRAIMEKWGLGPLAVETVKVNDAAAMPAKRGRWPRSMSSRAGRSFCRPSASGCGGVRSRPGRRRSSRSCCSAGASVGARACSGPGSRGFSSTRGSLAASS